MAIMIEANPLTPEMFQSNPILAAAHITKYEDFGKISSSQWQEYIKQAYDAWMMAPYYEYLAGGKTYAWDEDEAELEKIVNEGL